MVAVSDVSKITCVCVFLLPQTGLGTQKKEAGGLYGLHHRKEEYLFWTLDSNSIIIGIATEGRINRVSTSWTAVRPQMLPRCRLTGGLILGIRYLPPAPVGACWLSGQWVARF